MKKQTPYMFFKAQAGYSYDPLTETPAQGRARCALDLAKAEKIASERGWSVQWTEDGEVYGQQGDCFDVLTRPWEFDGEKFTGYDAVLYGENGDVLGALGGCTFKEGDPFSDPYRRVVEAELALQALSEEQKAAA